MSCMRGTERLLASIVLGLSFDAVATSTGEFVGAIGRCDGLIIGDEAIEHARVFVDATDLLVTAGLENGVSMTCRP